MPALRRRLHPSPALRSAALLAMLLCLAGCLSGEPREPLPTAAQVDLPRFMGDWYVISSIPTPFERNAYNAMERYELRPNGSIATRFEYRDGGFDGAQKSMSPTGYVRDETTNAVWGMQIFWPLRSEYRVMFVDPDYEVTLIGRSARDYLWVMARTPQLAPDRYEAVLRLAETAGYDLSKLRIVPQRWSVAAN